MPANSDQEPDHTIPAPCRLSPRGEGSRSKGMDEAIPPPPLSLQPLSTSFHKPSKLIHNCAVGEGLDDSAREHVGDFVDDDVGENLKRA